jgi:hypothetical protein
MTEQQRLGLIVMAYGTPRTPAEIEPYYTHIRRGRAATPEQLADLISRYDAIGGMDERFVGWGQEDDDLGLRLRAVGVRLESILDRTWSLHVWHPVDTSATPRWRDGVNVPYFLRHGRLKRCRHGLLDRAAHDVLWGLPADATDTPLGREVLALLADSPQTTPGEPCEVEIVLRPGRGRFERKAECRLLLIEGEAEPSLRRQIDQIHELEAAAADRSVQLSRILASCG